MNLARREAAEDAAVKALEKGGLRDPSGAGILLGMSQYNQKSFVAPRRTFARAGEDPASAALAQRWMDFIAQEEENEALVRGVGSR